MVNLPLFLFLCLAAMSREAACQGLSAEKGNSALRIHLVFYRSQGYIALRKSKLVYAGNKAV